MTGKYAADRAATILLDAGARHGPVDLAGDVRALGPQESGAPWRIGISHSRHEGKAIAYVELASGAIATSGDYERVVAVAADGSIHGNAAEPK